MTDWLTSADAARILEVTPAAVREMARSGRLRVKARTESGIRLFARRDVERLAAKRFGEQETPEALPPGDPASRP